MEAIVYVKGYNGNTLSSTKRCGHVRWLLKNGKAKVIRKKPFQIQLLYQEEEKYKTKETQKTVLGIDPECQN
ncbi:MAG: RRXRR domain-containing protein [Desulfovibrio sp.]|nr:RRXRR domain-containing protein [Desulfovibrio sp.]